LVYEQGKNCSVVVVVVDPNFTDNDVTDNKELAATFNWSQPVHQQDSGYKEFEGILMMHAVDSRFLLLVKTP